MDDLDRLQIKIDNYIESCEQSRKIEKRLMYVFSVLFVLAFCLVCGHFITKCSNTEIYIQFIERFYADNKFNELYYKWIETGDKWIKPSLDHIEAKCNGGSLLIDNLQFISWLENRAKVDIDQELWNRMKQNINYYL